MQLIGEALTFDDVSLVPAYSQVLPGDVDLKTRLTREINLNAPLVSAAMDTVTEARLAIAMAQDGGIGVVHKNMTLEQQAEQVQIVKKFEAGVIKDPITVRPDTSIREVLDLTHRHNISGVPVVDGNELVGIVTSRDLRFEKRLGDPVRNIMTGKDNLVTVQENASQDEILNLLHRYRIEKVLVVNEQFELRGLVTVKDIQKSTDHPNAAKDSQERLLVAAAVGVGVPQVTAVTNVANALKESGVPLIADGGIRFSGDFAKAVAAGAWTVMIGGLFAGTEEAPGEVELFQGRSYKSYRGMGSLGAMQEGSKDRYFQHDVSAEKLVPEGIEGRVPYKGALSGVIHQLLGGLRSSMGYMGCDTVERFRTESRFVRITNAGIRESHAHDVQITKEAPNYKLS